MPYFLSKFEDISFWCLVLRSTHHLHIGVQLINVTKLGPISLLLKSTHGCRVDHPHSCSSETLQCTSKLHSLSEIEAKFLQQYAGKANMANKLPMRRKDANVSQKPAPICSGSITIYKIKDA